VLSQISSVELPKSVEDPPLVRQLADIDSMTTFAAIKERVVLAVGALDIPEPAVPSVGDIRVLAVTPGYREGGGLGSSIVDLLEERARETGVRRLQVESLDSASDFYEKLGYQAVRNKDFVKFL
jgi:N-acetylglutamate synthase-like GNAT family acetyltransferase